MGSIAVVASVVLGLVFVVAGASKLAAGDRWRTNAGQLGVPDRLSAIVPWVELAVGAALVVRLAVPVPAVIAAVLLLAFTVALAWHLRGPDRPSCACFGAWSDSEIGAGHIVRNAVLLGVSVLAMLG